MPVIPADSRSITSAWLSDALEADVCACEFEQIAIGVGLLGRLYRVHLDGGPELPSTVVVKLPTLDTRARTAICEELKFYLREVRFYQEIGLANPLPPARPYFAAFDDATHDFVLVLEDLGRLRRPDQTVGCSAADAETVVDAIARHHAHWCDDDRLASLTWLGSYSEPPFPESTIGNYKAGWPVFVERLGYDLSPEMLEFGERFPSLMPWFQEELTRPPVTFVHGDLRLDQLFFAVGPDDPPVTVLDWQLTAMARGAYDLGYFVTQSLTPDTRRSCEDQLIERYAERMAGYGVHYSLEQIRLDYRLTATLCFAYPVIGAGRIDVANDRQLQLLRTMLNGAVNAIEDHDGLSLGPD